MSTTATQEKPERAAGSAASAKENAFFTYDLIVVALGAAIIAVGYLAQGGGAAVKTEYASWEKEGLTVRYPKNNLWQPPTGTAYPQVMLSGQCSMNPKDQCDDTPPARVEVRLYEDEMGLGSIEAGREHEKDYASRAKRQIAAEESRLIGDREWQCSRFGYVPLNASRETMAVECVVVNNKKVYIVTLSGPEKYLSELEPQIIGTLVVK